jgi:uncharacterized pyridoxamine 5'-phosphate oxidase family protein
MKKQMPENQLKDEIFGFLKKRKELVLCTCNDNIPRATPMDFYTENDSFNIYVGLSPGRKVKNIEENPVISIGIYTPMTEGKVREGDEGFDKAQKIVRGKRKLILKINPEIIELLDYDFAKSGYAILQKLEL